MKKFFIFFLPKKIYLGSQISAINIQMLKDDNTLLNTIFFMQNKGSGYVLKPKTLRCRKTIYNELYELPKKRLSITLISGYLLNLMGKEIFL